jgi:cytochrome c oxidase subunit III
VAETAMTTGGGHGAAMEAPYFGIGSKKFAMWMFIIADSATFGAIMMAYGYLRVGSPNWTRPFTFYPTIVNGLVMTVVLLVSSLTMIAAILAAKAGDRPKSVRWMVATLLLGTLFAGLHVREWLALIREGWSPSANPEGGSVLFGATYFGITGLSLLHVVAGVVALVVVALKFRRGRLTDGHIETTGLYWHFVSVVWMFVFPLVYLMNAR